jgi:hypothetical protein
MRLSVHLHRGASRLVVNGWVSMTRLASMKDSGAAAGVDMYGAIVRLSLVHSEVRGVYANKMMIRKDRLEVQLLERPNAETPPAEDGGLRGGAETLQKRLQQMKK